MSTQTHIQTQEKHEKERRRKIRAVTGFYVHHVSLVQLSPIYGKHVNTANVYKIV